MSICFKGYFYIVDACNVVFKGSGQIELSCQLLIESLLESLDECMSEDMVLSDFCLRCNKAELCKVLIKQSIQLFKLE